MKQPHICLKIINAKAWSSGRVFVPMTRTNLISTTLVPKLHVRHLVQLLVRTLSIDRSRGAGQKKTQKLAKGRCCILYIRFERESAAAAEGLLNRLHHITTMSVTAY